MVRVGWWWGLQLQLQLLGTLLAPSARGLTPSAAVRAGSFLLRGQKKRTKEKAAPHTRPFGVPSRRTIEAAAAELGRCAPSDSPRRNPAPLVLYSALLRGPGQTILTPNPSP
ncbi:hypothetical protein YWS52_36490 [Chitiniphilus shinanonensis]